MSKYIDAEKLISEILKLRSESCISESDDYYEYAKSEIIDIIESLQQERPEVDLENEIAIYLNREFLNRIKNDETIDGFTTLDAGEIAEYFAKWGAEHLVEK